ncbi:hypothetical protein RDABS01_021864 [Bienertia sinuspersici]
MTIQDFLKTLKTAKKTLPSSISCSLDNEHTPIKTLLNSIFNNTCSATATTPTSHNTIPSFLSSLSSHQLQSFISDPKIKTYDCLRVFNLVLHNQSELSFRPDFHAHLTLVCRLIKSSMHSDAEILMEKLILGPKYRYPFSDFIRWVDKYCKESRIITKLWNMLLKLYSDHQMFGMVDTTFEHMVQKDVEIDEKTCSVHLNTLIKSNRVDLAFEYFCGMMDSGMNISVFSWTIVVSGLCNIGELKMARELVEEMLEKGVKPNIITFNTLVDACSRRWKFEELDMVLCLMEREDIQFNDKTYTLLVEGYSASSKVDEAKRLLLEMQDNGFEAKTYLYFVVIRGYCRLGNIESGVSLLRIMQEREIVACDGIYQCLICCMCKDGEMDQAKEFVNELLNKGGEVSHVMFNALKDGYQKAGMMDELEEMKSRVGMKCHSDNESC